MGHLNAPQQEPQKLGARGVARGGGCDKAQATACAGTVTTRHGRGLGQRSRAAHRGNSPMRVVDLCGFFPIFQHILASKDGKRSTYLGAIPATVSAGPPKVPRRSACDVHRTGSQQEYPLCSRNANTPLTSLASIRASGTQRTAAARLCPAHPLVRGPPGQGLSFKSNLTSRARAEFPPDRSASAARHGMQFPSTADEPAVHAPDGQSTALAKQKSGVNLLLVCRRHGLPQRLVRRQVLWRHVELEHLAPELLQQCTRRGV